MTKPLASLSLDLDNEWTYLKMHGDAGWRKLPSYLDVVVPRILDFLADCDNQRITFFVVGQDAALKKNQEAIASIARNGHEIGNHSFHHEPSMHLHTPQQIVDDLQSAEWHIERVTGQHPAGFRSPCATARATGFHRMSDTLPATLVKLGYTYDASSRVTQRRGTKLHHLPLLRPPIHFSRIIHLSRFSQALALGYFRSAVKMCELTGTQPSLLLHPFDFLGKEDLSTQQFFPGMELARERKLEMMTTLVNDLRMRFRVVPMIEYARAAAASNLRAKDLAYASGGAA